MIQNTLATNITPYIHMISLYIKMWYKIQVLVLQSTLIFPVFEIFEFLMLMLFGFIIISGYPSNCIYVVCLLSY